jgi:hypothetical protein
VEKSVVESKCKTGLIAPEGILATIEFTSVDGEVNDTEVVPEIDLGSRLGGKVAPVV